MQVFGPNAHSPTGFGIAEVEGVAFRAATIMPGSKPTATFRATHELSERKIFTRFLIRLLFRPSTDDFLNGIKNLLRNQRFVQTLHANVTADNPASIKFVAEHIVKTLTRNLAARRAAKT